MRRALRVVALLVVAAAAGIAAIALDSRSGLDEAEHDVAAAWADVVAHLDTRADALDTANEAVRDQGGGARAVVGEIDSALVAWTDLRDGDDLAAQITAANDLEALGRRLRATVADSPRFATAAVTAALDAYEETALEHTAAAATQVLDDAIDRYADERGGTLRRLVTDALGYGDIARLDA